MIEVLAVTPDSRFIEGLRTRYGTELSLHHEWPVSNGHLDTTMLQRQLMSRHPHVVMLGPGMDETQLPSLIRSIDHTFPETTVVAISSFDKVPIVEMYKAGATNALASDALGDNIHAVLVDAADRASSRRMGDLAGDQESGKSSTVVLLSPKGGAGKTTIAINTGVALAARRPQRVALVDLDLQFGDVASSLNIVADATIAEITDRGVVDTKKLKLSLSRHESHLLVLSAPDSFTAAESVEPQHTKEILTSLSTAFPLTLVDTASGIDETTLTAAENATDLLFIVTTDVTSVRAVKRQLQAFDSLGLTSQERHLVINRANNKLGMTRADIERTLDLHAMALIPSSPDLASSANQGVSLQTIAPRDRALRAFEQIADQFVPREAPTTTKFWRR